MRKHKLREQTALTMTLCLTMVATVLSGCGGKECLGSQNNPESAQKHR